MKEHLEIEKKFFLDDTGIVNTLIDQLKVAPFSQLFENDAYFTDWSGSYVENRTCLRVRETENNEFLSIDFKGKSGDLGNLYAKSELNVPVSKNQISGFFRLFSLLGFHKYVSVNKNRTTYRREDGHYQLNLVVDEITGIGSFIEIELTVSLSKVSHQEAERYFHNEILSKLDNIPMSEALLPYRDIVGKEVKQEFLSTPGHIFIDVDYLYCSMQNSNGRGFSEMQQFNSFFYAEMVPNFDESAQNISQSDAHALSLLNRTIPIVMVTSAPTQLARLIPEIPILSIMEAKNIASAKDTLISSSQNMESQFSQLKSLVKRHTPGISILGCGKFQIDTYAELYLIHQYA